MAKVYVNRNDEANNLILAILNGEKKNITVTFSNRPYCCLDIWGDFINTLEYIKSYGCTEYVFPERSK